MRCRRMSRQAVEASTRPATWNCTVSLSVTLEKAMEEFRPSAVSNIVAEEDITAVRRPHAIRLPDVGGTEIVAHAANAIAIAVAATPTERLRVMPMSHG